MDDPYDLMLAMLALAIAAAVLVAGELYLVTRPDEAEKYTASPSAVTSSVSE